MSENIVSLEDRRIAAIPEAGTMEETIAELQRAVEQMDGGMKLCIEAIAQMQLRLNALEKCVSILWEARQNKPAILNSAGKRAN